MTAGGIAETAISTFTARERQRSIAQNPQSVALAERARFHDVDGHEYLDFCLGGTGHAQPRESKKRTTAALPTLD